MTMLETSVMRVSVELNVGLLWRSQSMTVSYKLPRHNTYNTCTIFSLEWERPACVQKPFPTVHNMNPEDQIITENNHMSDILYAE